MRSFPGKGVWQRAVKRTDCALQQIAAPFRKRDIAFFHQFAPPPDGGGHQFMRALMRELAGRGWRMENNTISGTTRACLFNSFNFDADRLRRLQRRGCRMIHRIDGPIATYRGWDDGTDRRIWDLNREFADATILQSRYSLDKHRELGFEVGDAVVIANAADPELFHRQGRRDFDATRKIRLVSTSWSDNPNKGSPIYSALDSMLDWQRYEYTFIGRPGFSPRNIRVVPPCDSQRVAELLRMSDIYITASRHDPCSNSLVEALSCGLPAVYRNSGGHHELVGEGGEPFDAAEDIPGILQRITDNYTFYAQRVQPAALSDVANAYLTVMNLSAVQS